MLAGTALVLAALTWTAAAQGGSVDEDLFSCAGQCADIEAEVEARIQDGWTCTEHRESAAAQWRCTRRPGSTAAAGAAILLLSSCESDKPTLEKDAERADVLHTSDVPDGSSGSLVAVADGGVVTCRGWGESDQKTDTAAGCDTVYDIGSITEGFTAAAVVKLQMQGRLKATDSLGDYFDGVPADKAGMTLHHLLTHSAGLPDVFGDDYDDAAARRW